MMNTMRKLVLFDIDGTLVLTGGAGIRAMNRACEDLVGHPHALAGIPVAGRTDRIILTDVVAREGHALDDGLLDRLRERDCARGGDSHRGDRQIPELSSFRVFLCSSVVHVQRSS